jgi:DNA mismatch repair protein MutS2
VRVDAALERTSSFLAKMALENRDVAFVLHGHGTGALKRAVREWLRESTMIRAWRPCDPGEGGDAYTIVRIP